ncbi:MAG TPA: D-isomer specific 2-hydroxyacid dehydrogenase family protein [Myxococcota bacterium]|nr:D-isomer specific 2-hydroxyacid dehydrogenase family protein [Myxococcota bacterium]
MKLLRWGRAEYEDQPFENLGVDVVEDSSDDPALEEADFLVVPSRRRVDAAVVSRLKNCKLVLTTTSGHDHLDLDALGAAGIPAARLPLARRDAVVQTALGMLLMLSRRLGHFYVATEQERWRRAELPQIGATLLGTVGIVGAGVIGRRMAEVLAPLAEQVLICDPRHPAHQPLAELLQRCDALTLHCPLNPSTRLLFREDLLQKMRPGSILVNTARGKILDPRAAMAAVHSGHLAGLGIDVFPVEPCSLLPFAHPAVIASPHAAGWHPRLGEAIVTGLREAIRAVQQGQPIPFRLSPGD